MGRKLVPEQKAGRISHGDWVNGNRQGIMRVKRVVSAEEAAD